VIRVALGLAALIVAVSLAPPSDPARARPTDGLITVATVILLAVGLGLVIAGLEDLR
jgi:hypothetical protein